MSPRAKPRRARKPPDPLRDDFGPEPGAPPPGAEGEAPVRPGERPFGAIPCTGEGCLLKPFADLVSKFAFRIVRGHGPSLGRAASSGIEMMKAMRDFLDEEIALTESLAASRAGAPRVTRIKVE